ncbi:MAG: aminotransferase class I/II-fold pyridoxal phosphate-dependent enzyme [Ignavibacteria bacterium]|nr:aminotransferase class I/II-fold pyridoxal phosphate-dependent enzyme [Ignavibacteria bacterium]
MSKKDEKKYTMETHLIYGRAFTEKWDYNHHVVPPISSSTTFRLDSAERGAKGFSEFGNTCFLPDGESPIYIYDRMGEPNKEILEENLALAEMGETAVTFATGMGAISAIFGVLAQSGDEIICHKTLYGCTFSLLNNWYPRYNIGVKKIDMTNLENLKNATSEKTRVVYFESPSNPNLEIIDISAVTKLVKDVNSKRDEKTQIKVAVDNTFATPYCQRPITLGVDFVVHSLTKNIGGFGTDMGGVVICPKKYRDVIMLYRKDFGAVLGAKSAWPIVVYGLTSLPIRLQKEIKSATKIAEFLSNHPAISYVNYPGLTSFKYHEIAKKQMKDYEGNFSPGNMLYFGIKGRNAEEGKANGKKIMDFIAENSYTITLAVSLGHIRTLVEHPGSMTHSMIPADEQIREGIDPTGIRMSVGLENPDDIIKDLSEALSIL